MNNVAHKHNRGSLSLEAIPYNPNGAAAWTEGNVSFTLNQTGDKKLGRPYQLILSA